MDNRLKTATPWSGQLHYLIDCGEHLSETGIGQMFQRMEYAAAEPPVEGLWLMTEQVTGLSGFAPACNANEHCEGIVGEVIICAGIGTGFVASAR